MEKKEKLFASFAARRLHIEFFSFHLFFPSFRRKQILGKVLSEVYGVNYFFVSLALFGFPGGRKITWKFSFFFSSWKRRVLRRFRCVILTGSHGTCLISLRGRDLVDFIGAVFESRWKGQQRMLRLDFVWIFKRIEFENGNCMTNLGFQIHYDTKDLRKVSDCFGNCDSRDRSEFRTLYSKEGKKKIACELQIQTLCFPESYHE